MSLKKKILIYSVITVLSLTALYFLLGSEHPWVVFVTTMFILAKLKTIAVFSLVLSKAYLFLSASKGKIFAFISKLTFFKGLSLAIKRFIIDNVISKWIDKHIISHIKGPIKEFVVYYKSLNWKMKIKKTIIFIVPAGVISFLLYIGGYIQSLAFYAQLKALVIGFFKILWVVLSKVIASVTYFFTNFIAGTWLAPIVEIFALSWLLSLIERIPYIGPYIKRFFDFIGQGINVVFASVTFYFNKYFGNWISGHVGEYGKRFGHFIERKVNHTKVKNELFIFDGFEKKYLETDVQEYFKGKHPRDNKVEFYRSVNKKTADNIDIVAFIELDSSFKEIKDFLIVEGIASSNTTGADGEHAEIKKASFWVLNLNEKSFFVLSRGNYFEPIFISQNSLKLIHPRCEKYDFKDLYIIDLDKNKYRKVELVIEEDEKDEN